MIVLLVSALIVILILAFRPGTTLPTPPSSPTSGLARATVAPTHPACEGKDPHANVYDPDRLVLIAACTTATGTVVTLHASEDGDLSLALRLDPGQDDLLNAANRQTVAGDLIVEIVCVDRSARTFATQACAGYVNPILAPRLGARIAVTGPHVLDSHHGWNEIHPVWAIEVLAPPLFITLSRFGSVAAATIPGASCSVTLFVPSGEGESALTLPSQLADDAGNVSWTYRVGSLPGGGTHRVTCSYQGRSQTTSAVFTVP